jgi:hypothetical protein
MQIAQSERKEFGRIRIWKTSTLARNHPAQRDRVSPKPGGEVTTKDVHHEVPEEERGENDPFLVISPTKLGSHTSVAPQGDRDVRSHRVQ